MWTEAIAFIFFCALARDRNFLNPRLVITAYNERRQFLSGISLLG